MILTENKNTGLYNYGDPIPNIPGSGYSLMNDSVNSLTLNTDYSISKTFTANKNFSWLWYFPWSKDYRTISTMTIKAVNICIIDPCA